MAKERRRIGKVNSARSKSRFEAKESPGGSTRSGFMANLGREGIKRQQENMRRTADMIDEIGPEGKAKPSRHRMLRIEPPLSVKKAKGEGSQNAAALKMAKARGAAYNKSRVHLVHDGSGSLVMQTKKARGKQSGQHKRVSAK